MKNDYSIFNLIELWSMANAGDEEAKIEISARGFNIDSFCNRPVEEFL